MSALLALALAAQGAGSLDPRTLAQVSARPVADTRLPGRLAFMRPDGTRTNLSDIAAGKPLVLVLADYTCRHVCGSGLALSAAALMRTGLTPGRDFRLAIVGLDPHDGPAAARAMTAQLGAPALVRATDVLLGDDIATPSLTRAIGYTYAYDAAADQFAHDAALYVFAADGRLTSVLPELGAAPPALKAAIVGTTPPLESLGARVAHLCYGFAAAHGRYGGPAIAGLQMLSGMLLAGAGWWFWRRRRVA